MLKKAGPWALLLGLMLLCLRPVVYGQDSVQAPMFSDTLALQGDIFASDEPMKLTLKFNIKMYQRKKHRGEYMPVDLFYHVNDSVGIRKEVRVKARGNFRRSHCHFPPFWLNIRKTDIDNPYLEGTKRMKVVTHCQGSRQYNDYVLREYLIYRMYELISPYSFRTRLMKVKYIDTGRRDREYEAWAFLIEPEEMMAERLDAVPIKLDHLNMAQMDPVWMDKMALFQYMIGNGDYSIVKRHNVKLIKLRDTDSPLPIPVPYDFDYSGFVNTYYAIPGEDLGIDNVRERYFLGRCRSDQGYMRTIEALEEYEEAFYALISGFEFMEEKSKEDCIGYLEEYFRSTEDPERFIGRSLDPTCR